jgi:hypothetical protein
MKAQAHHHSDQREDPSSQSCPDTVYASRSDRPPRRSPVRQDISFKSSKSKINPKSWHTFRQPKSCQQATVSGRAFTVNSPSTHRVLHTIFPKYPCKIAHPPSAKKMTVHLRQARPILRLEQCVPGEGHNSSSSALSGGRSRDRPVLATRKGYGVKLGTAVSSSGKRITTPGQGSLVTFVRMRKSL